MTPSGPLREILDLDTDLLLNALDGMSHVQDALRDARSTEKLGAGVAFLLQHESYHIGQIALLRRQLGCPAPTYGRRGEESA